MPALRPCLTCGRLVRGRSYCPRHEPAHPSPSALNGLSRSPATRRAVLARDRACVRCGATDRLEVHHLRAVADGGTNDPANLVTLCDPCHRAVHRSAA